ncbi:MAG: reverse transcriptase domain-containing protein, partial [Candidatus Thiodiazotropha endolucinida]|nr:hypothetical protein [Candidatus Thiodiazotropha taylori]MCW4264446.1 reverse transcriptase domain-containing protein [Candidatus Thiodiazotropha endolucinida]
MSDTIEMTGLDRFVDLPDDIDLLSCSTVRASDDKTVNVFGHKLISLCKELGLCIANGRLEPGRFTFQSSNGCSVVDYFITKPPNFKHISKMEILDPCEFSDHCAMCFSMSFTEYITEEAEKLADKIFWDSSRAQSIIDNLNSKRGSFDEIISLQLEQLADVNGCVQQLTDLMYDSCFSVFGKTVSTKSNENSSKASWFNLDCKRAKKDFYSSKRLFKASPTQENKARFFAHKKTFRNAKRKAECAYIKRTKRDMTNLSKTSPRKSWKKINRFRKGKLSPSGRISIDKFVEHFNLISNTPHTDKAFDVPDFDNINIVELDREISVNEISGAIDSMKRGKSPGADGLVSDFFIDAKSFLVPYLHKVYNYILETGIYPTIWSEGLIVPIPKKGDLSDPTNYRGITLISTFAKLFSLIVRNRINNWCEDQNHLDNCQFGFRDGRSTADCIFILQSIIQKTFNNKSKLYCAFIDYEKAFDTIIHDAMWTKLINTGVSSKIVSIVRSIYSKITAAIKLNDDISSCFDICLGLKQGEPLSLLLFVLFINDIRHHLQGEGADGTINGISIAQLSLFILLFADDMVLFSENPDELQVLLNRLYQYSTDWGLKVNTLKTKICIFQKRRQAAARAWIYNNEELEIVDSFCYLGLKFYYNGNIEMSTKTLSEQALRAANNLLALFKRISFDVKTKLSLFDSLVTPIILYGAEYWGIFDIKNVDRIHIKRKGI